MDVREIHDKQTWNAFVRANGPRSGTFLQMWEWGRFQEATGHPVKRIGVFVDGAPVAVAQCLRFTLPFGKYYYYCPRGPVVKHTADTKRAVDALQSALGSAFFFRFEPLTEDDWEAQATRIEDVQPAHTLLTDLSLEPDDLLMNMHAKTRYNVRLSKRKGVTVQISADVSIEDAWPLFEETAQRGGFVLHDRAYYEKMLTHVAGDDVRAFLATAHFETKMLAVNLMIDCDGVRTYLHGASGSEHRNLMAPYRLHWELMKNAKDMDLSWYDWWGVAPEGAGEHHPLHGVSRFKKKFGGERVGYPGTFDVPFDRFWYALYRAAKRFR